MSTFECTRKHYEREIYRMHMPMIKLSDMLMLIEMMMTEIKLWHGNINSMCRKIKLLVISQEN